MVSSEFPHTPASHTHKARKRTTTVSRRFCRTICSTLQQVISIRRQLRCVRIISPLLVVSTILAIIPSSMLKASGVDRVLELISQELGTDADAATVDLLDHYHAQPLNLRICSRQDLAGLPFWSVDISERFLQTLRANPNASLDELIRVSGLDILCAEVLRCCSRLPSASAEAKPARSRADSQSGSERRQSAPSRLLSDSTAIQVRQRSMLPLEINRGTNEHIYAGSALSASERILLQSTWLECSAVVEKDAGEASYADFLSAAAQVRVTDNTRIIAGDYRCNAGFGLVLAPGVVANASPTSMSVFNRVGQGLNPSHSTLNTSFFRGAAAEHRLLLDSSVLNLRLGLSSRSLDAGIDSSSGLVSSINRTELHRTSSEINHKGALDEHALLSSAEYRSDSYLIGAECLGLTYNHEFGDSPSADIVGRSAFLCGMYAWYRLGGYSLNAECARDQLGSLSVLGTVISQHTSGSELIRVWRSPRRFYSPYAATFGSMENEQGSYIAAVRRISGGLQIGLSVDLRSSIVPRLYTAFRAGSMSIQTEVRWKLNSTSEVRLHARESLTRDAEHTVQDVLSVAALRRHELRALYAMQTSAESSISVQASFCAQDATAWLRSESGSMISISAKGTIGAGLHWSGGCALASSSSFAAALYETEQLAPGTWSSMPLYGQAMRAVCGMQYQLWDGGSVWLRVDYSAKNDVSTLSSSYDEIQGNHQSHLLMQLDLSL